MNEPERAKIITGRAFFKKEKNNALNEEIGWYEKGCAFSFFDGSLYNWVILTVQCPSVSFLRVY